MKPSMTFTAAAALGAALSSTFAADDLPRQQAFTRYEAMMNRSPFAVATAAAVPAATPNFAKDLYIANAAQTPNGDLVTLASSTDKNFKKYLSTRETVDGFSIPSIEWSERVGATKVTINKDGQFATLTFNQALLSQPVANQPVPQQPPPNQLVPQGVPPVPAYNTNIVKPAPIPTLPTPPPRVRGVIQRNPSAIATPFPVPQPEVEEE